MADGPLTEVPGNDRNGTNEDDVARLAEPRTETLRAIAAMLGARFAGDASSPAKPAAPPPPPPADPKAAALLETLPLPLLVTKGDAIAYVNRAARALTGYASAATMQAAGGLAELFEGMPGSIHGTLALRSAAGRRFTARAEVTPIDWAGERAGLLSLQEVVAAAPDPAVDTPASEHAGAPAENISDDVEALETLLSTHPDPIAIVSRGGLVSLANAAYRALGTADDDLSLAQRLDAGALEAILLTVGEAYAAPTRSAELKSPISVAGRTMSVTVAIVEGEGEACVAFHPVPSATAGAAPLRAVEEEAAAVDRAVTQAAALVREAGVAIILEGGPALPLETEFAEETERFFRALLVFLGARSAPGTRIRLERRPWTYALDLEPAGRAALGEVTASSRLVLFGLEAGLALAIPPEGGLSIAPLLTP